jgi:hypothetical protein
MTEMMKRLSKQDIRNTMAMIWVILSFYFLFTLLRMTIPTDNKDILMVISGVIVGKLTDIMGYYFTQSKSEVDQQKKTDA